MARKREMPPPPRYWECVQTVWDAISIYDGPGVFLDQFSRANPGVGHLFAAHWCQSEVFNGGFYQFFTNPTGVLAPEALAGFRAIGLDEWATALEGAMRFFGEPYPRDQKAREAKIRATGRKGADRLKLFEESDDRFYAWSKEHRDGFTASANAYAEANSL